jgi:hypothetical protein
VQAELNVEQWEQTPSGEIYTFSHPEASYDDRFWAICLAVMATLKIEPQKPIHDFCVIFKRRNQITKIIIIH